LVDLLDYWIYLPNSIHPDNPGRTFWFAVRRGVWRAGEHLADGIHAASHIEFLDDIPGLEAPDEEVVELLVQDDFERAEALRLVEELDDTRADWLKGYLRGQTQAEEAAATGVPRTTVETRRHSATRALRLLAAQTGLL
jgi:DNA-directed RNA polymerase specialized sigma24 family protein